MGDQIRHLGEAYVFLKWTDGRYEHFRLDSVDRAPCLAEYQVFVDVEEDEPEGSSTRARPGDRQTVSLRLDGRGPREPGFTAALDAARIAEAMSVASRWDERVGRTADPTSVRITERPDGAAEFRIPTGPAIEQADD